MGTITYAYEPGATVFVVTSNGSCAPAVREGTIIQVRINALITGTTIKYDVRLGNDTGTVEFDGADVYSTLDGAGSPVGSGSPSIGALDAYKTSLT
jgi:hypothetical protein